MPTTPRCARNGGLAAGGWRSEPRPAAPVHSGTHPVMMPKKGAKSRIPPQESLEIWMAVANMEQLMAKDKIAWGNLLLSEISSKKARPQHLWSLSRIGARELLTWPPTDRCAVHELAKPQAAGTDPDSNGPEPETGSGPGTRQNGPDSGMAGRQGRTPAPWPGIFPRSCPYSVRRKARFSANRFLLALCFTRTRLFFIRAWLAGC